MHGKIKLNKSTLQLLEIFSKRELKDKWLNFEDICNKRDMKGKLIYEGAVSNIHRELHLLKFGGFIIEQKEPNNRGGFHSTEWIINKDNIIPKFTDDDCKDFISLLTMSITQQYDKYEKTLKRLFDVAHKAHSKGLTKQELKEIICEDIMNL